MKRFVFVSDFDGTMTANDFCFIVIDECLGEQGWELYDQWQRNALTTLEFLTLVFRDMRCDEQGIDRLIGRIEMDEYVPEFVRRVRDAGGEFVVLSAGADYYVQRFLAQQGLADVRVIANHGEFSNRGIKLKTDEGRYEYSSEYGIDKAAVIRAFKGEYEQVYFAGDSRPDLAAALTADGAFAKGSLTALLCDRQAAFTPVRNFRDIAAGLQLAGVLGTPGD